MIEKVVVDFRHEKPSLEELKPLAEGLGLDFTGEECMANSIEIRAMKAERDACASCNSFETCTLDTPGYLTAFSGRGYGGTPCFGIKACDRFKQYCEMVKNEKLLEGCKIPHVLRQKTFKNYDAKDNPRAVEVALDFIQGSRTKGAIFYGPTGVGKTHIAAAILNNQIVNGRIGIYVTLPDLMDSLRSAMRNECLESARAALIETEVLFLDDIGAENPTEFVCEELFKIVNGRWLNNRVIIGTSNLTPEGIRERYSGLSGARIFSRLSELCEWVEMKGRDHRI